ncbi:hypothetical protein ACI6QG_05830 [Roseococcus sp. DSY-14]|uniref:hypothetical protein n=1 Tax=Roseococcus sp. DSY-14 TaxID=3369650 RepID=UPI00387AD649
MRKILLTHICLALAAMPAYAQGNLGTSAQAPGTGMSRSVDTTSPNTTDPLRSGGQVTDGRSSGATSGPNATAETRPNMGAPMGVNPAAGTAGSGNASGATFGSSTSAAPSGVPGSGSGTGVSGTQMGSSTSAAPTVTNTTGTAGNRPMGQAGTPAAGQAGTATGSTSAITNNTVDGRNSTGAATGQNATMPTGAAGGTATGSNVTNAPVGAAMDNSRGGREAAANDSDRRDRDGRVNVVPAGTAGVGDQPGANSFTEGQARARIEEAGFSQVGELTRDNNGVWRGQAMREGRQVQVGLDFQGTVTFR